MKVCNALNKLLLFGLLFSTTNCYADLPIPVYAKFDVTGGWTNTISICNNSAYNLPLKNIELDFVYTGNQINSIWGSPYLDWNINSNQNKYRLTASSSLPPLSPDPDCKKPMTVQFNSEPNSPLPSQLILKSEGGHPMEYGNLKVQMTSSPFPGAPAPIVTVNGMNINNEKHTLPWGNNWDLNSTVVGTYTVSANNLINNDAFYGALVTPNPVVINKDQTSVTTITYKPLTTGTLIVHFVNAPDASETVFLKSALYSTQKTISQDQQLTLPAGAYTVSSRIKHALTISTPNPLVIQNQKPTHLIINYQKISGVMGWPNNKIAMGTIVNGGMEENFLKQRPVDAVFTYAGINGAGDRGQIISHDTKAASIMAEARRLENATHSAIMPVFVFYSVDGSDGENAILQDLGYNPDTKQPEPKYFDYLVKHFINLIALSNQLENYKDSEHPFPASIILNPDFLGELHKQCQPGNCPIDYQHFPIQVGTALKAAIDYINNNNLLGYPFDPSMIPARFMSDSTEIPDYLSAVDWIIYTFAPDVPFGWQDNVWAGDPTGHEWIHAARNDTTNNILAKHILDETTYLNQLQLYEDTYAPDYLAFDKYERDVIQVGNNYVSDGYLYNAGDYEIYLGLVKGISENLNTIPTMLWQIPGGHLQITNDFDSRNDHASSDADFYVGDPLLNSDLSNIKSYILNTPFPNTNNNYQTTAKSIQAYLIICPPDQPDLCWKNNHLQQVKESHVFAMLWGGGSTTGIAGLSPALDDNGWLYKQLLRSRTSNIILNNPRSG